MFPRNSKINPDIITQLIDELGSLLYRYDLVVDSRLVNENSIFCAYPGTIKDGRDFIENVIDSGLKFILWEAGTNRRIDCPNLAVKNLNLYIGLLAAVKYSNPSLNYTTIGITGTNGKTSISYWLNQMYALNGKITGIIGTTGAGVYPNIVYNEATTPGPLLLQKILADFVISKVDIVAMEVSSHALHQGRVNGVAFKTAVFTNLTQDHLDYHGNMEEYYLAKRDLFFWQELRKAVINVDDKYGLRLFNEIDKSEVEVLDYGINHGTLRATDIKVSLSGVVFTLSYQSKSITVEAPVIGLFNVYNLLAVAGVLILDGYSLEHIANQMKQLRPVAGRMEAIVLPHKPLVTVDFSHTPDSLEKALYTLRQIEHSGKIYCIFGCGGNRDSLKRPLMGEIASRLSDYVIVTSDNPRFEQPREIIQQIISGIKKDNYIAIENRYEAIEYAIKHANSDDIILIAGKGHETYQEIQGVKYDFSDVVVAKKLLIGK